MGAAAVLNQCVPHQPQEVLEPQDILVATTAVFLPHVLE